MNDYDTKDMNDNPDKAYDALFRSYEGANRQIKELEAQLTLERERNANNVANADLQIAELQAEIRQLEIRVVDKRVELNEALTRLRSGGCARDQHTTQYCGEMQELVSRLTKLAEEWNAEDCYDKGRRETLNWCAERLMEAITAHSGEEGGAI